MCYVRKKKIYTIHKKKNKILWKKKQVNVQSPLSIPRKSVLCARLVINPVYFHCTSFVSSLSFCIFFVSFVFRFCFQCCCTRFQITAISQNPIFVKLPDSCTNVLTHISTEATKSHFSSSTNTNITVPTYTNLYRYQYNITLPLRTTSNINSSIPVMYI